jgi:hypothetical protein
MMRLNDSSFRTIRKVLVRGAIVILFFYSPIESVNPASRLAVIDSILARGTVATDDSPFFNTLDMVYVDGHFYSNKPPLLSFYSTAVVAPLHQIVTFTDPAWKILYFVIVLTSSGFALLAILLLLKALRKRLGEHTLSLRWLFGAVVGATCLLPFARTYNDHIVEAAVVLGIFALLIRFRDDRAAWIPPLVGVLLGIVAVMHPLPGIVFGGTTLLYFVVASLPRAPAGEATDLQARPAPVIGFILTAVVVAGAGVLLHYLLYGSPLSFYFTPELQLWAGVPGFADSYWLTDPSMPGLRADRIVSRFAELGIPDSRTEETLALLGVYQKGVRNPLSYASRQYFQYGQLSLTPLVVYCTVLGIRALRRPHWKYRLEWAWAILGVVGLYAAAVYLRAVPGGSFGNRLLLPALPLAVCAGAFTLSTAAERYVFKALVLVGVAMMAPGMIGPWTTPGASFLWFNLGINAICLAGIVWFMGYSRAAEIVTRWASRTEAGGPIPVAVAFALMVGLQFAFYLPALQFSP